MTEQQTKEWLAEKMNATFQRLKTNPKTRDFVESCLKFAGLSAANISITADSFDKYTNGDPVKAEKFYAMSKQILQRINQALDKCDLKEKSQ